MAKIISQIEWETFQRARQFTRSPRQNSLGKGFIIKFDSRLSPEDKERIKYLDKHGGGYAVREYIEDELLEK